MASSKEIDESLDNMEPEEKFSTLRQMLSDPTYSGGTYEKMMKDILRCYDTIGIKGITSKQLNAVTAHLNYHSKLWY